MKSLEWSLLAAKFYNFKNEAVQYGFYVPELAHMEESLELMRPFQDSPVVKEKAVEGYVCRGQKHTVENLVNLDPWVFAKTEVPKYDEEDELVEG